MDYVTGARGFVGKNLVRSLTDVRAIKWGQREKINTFENFYFLSAYGNMSFHKDTEMTVKANLLDVIDYYSRASRFNFNSFIYMSSSSVAHGEPTAYSRSKRAAEEYLLSYDRACIVRPYSITGIGEQPGHLIPTLIRSCLTGEHMDLVPWAEHDYVDVEDVVEALLFLSKTRAKGVVEVRTGLTYTNRQVRELVEQVTGKEANVSIVDTMNRPYDQKYDRLPKAHLNWGWMPQKTLRTSIEEMVHGRA